MGILARASNISTRPSAGMSAGRSCKAPQVQRTVYIGPFFTEDYILSVHSFSAARMAAAVVLACSLAACGGGGDDKAPDVIDTPVQQPDQPSGAGALQGATLLGTVTTSEMREAIAAKDSRVSGLQPLYAVTSYRVEYSTLGAQGQSVRASGLVSVPVKAAGSKSPVLSYQHGTIFRDAEAPSNNAVASEVAVVMASLGFIVVAPDYVGYGTSKGTPHPYLLSKPTAAGVIDFLTATQSWRQKQGVADNGQLFLTGYSEGGYVTMAAHRALQASGSPLLQQLQTVVTGAGPYDVQATMDGLVRLVRDENKLIGAVINPGFLRYLGGSVQRELRRQLLKQLLPDDADVVIDTQFIDRFLADDVQTIARDSSVYDWKPESPLFLYHGRDDRTVPYGSSVSALKAMQARGASQVSLTDCPATPSSHIGCVPPFLNFMLGKIVPLARDL